MITQEELQSDRDGTMRRAFGFAGVDESFTSEQFDREWEKSSAKESGRYQLAGEADQAPRLPQSFDRNFDRFPERMRWMVEKIVHDPDAPGRRSPSFRRDLEHLIAQFRDDAPGAPGVRRPRVRGLEGYASAYPDGMKIAVAADERTGVAEAVVEELRSAGTSRSPTAPSPATSATTGPGPARPPRATSPRAAPSRRSSAAGPAPGASIAANKVPGIRAALCLDAADRRGRPQVERRQRARAQPARDLGGRAGGDPGRVVRRRAERRGGRPRQRRAPGRDRVP